MTAAASLAALGAAAVAAASACWRWARVAQREHYIAGSCLRISRLWARRRPPNAAFDAVMGLGLAALAVFDGLSAIPRTMIAGATVAVAAVSPIGMAVVGSPPLKLTRRALTMLAVVVALAGLLGTALGLLADWLLAAAAVAVAMPLLTDLGLLVARPFETAAAQRHRTRAERKLRRVAPVVIAVTGSWGKTSVKSHIRDLLAGSADVVASPASWNNLAGLSRTVNEHLTDSTEVLVAEMGMYGPGEIRDLCDWVRPQVAVICAVGPMHLERVGSLEGIAGAKAEIVERCEKAVLWVDDPLVETHAMTRLADDAEVWRVGSRNAANAALSAGDQVHHDAARSEAAAGKSLDVEVDDDSSQIRIWHRGRPVGECESSPGLHPSNVGCAVAACLAHGLPVSEIGRRLPMLTPPKNRGGASVSERGVYVLDDTFNSNPQGAAAALQRLHSAVDGRKVLATPGMVELGEMQDDENRRLAAEARLLGIEVLAIGWTNRKALRQGAGDAVVPVKNRAAAAEWIRENLAEGDGVAWENDLPDHYP